MMNLVSLPGVWKACRKSLFFDGSAHKFVINTLRKQLSLEVHMRVRVSLVAVLCLLLLAPAALAVQIQVEGLQDSLAGAPTINHCTLRKAIINANMDAAIYPQCQAGSGHDEIVFDLPGTMTFTLVGILEDEGEEGDLDITDDLTIIGHPGGTTINAALIDRIFDVRGAGVTVTLRDLHLFNGYGLGAAGAIQLQQATLNLENVTINGCVADAGDGGAIYSANGATLNMVNVLITGNAASHHAGAIYVESGTVANITSSTIVSNGSGFPNLTGGIRSLGVTNLRNTIVAGNEDGGDLPNLDGAFVSLGYNIIGELGSNPVNPTIVPAAGDQFDVSFAALNIGAFQNNGGAVPSRALGAGSIAIDKGHSSGSSLDQRNFVRPCDDPGIANAAGGDGADVGAFEVQNGICGGPAAPEAADDAANVAEDSGANVIDVLANDTDANGDVLTITVVTQGAHGSVSTNGTTVSYTPNANYFGSDSFTYTIDDGNGGNDTAMVSVTVTNVNDAPLAAGEAYNVNQDTVLNVPAPGVLANDSDIDGDSLSAVLCAGAAHGNVVLNANGSFSYTPDPGYAGSDSFTYRAFDGLANSSCVTVTLTVLDTQAPTITPAVGVGTLWSPNNKLVDVGFSFNATDNGGGFVTTTVKVYSDEDDGATRDASGMLLLRAERNGNGDGRFYLIRITATDAANNTSTSCVTVTVPKSQSAAHVASVNAQAAAAQSACTGAGLFVVGD